MNTNDIIWHRGVVTLYIVLSSGRRKASRICGGRWKIMQDLDALRTELARRDFMRKLGIPMHQHQQEQPIAA